MPGDFIQQAGAPLAKDADLVAPNLWRSEFRNILAAFMRRGTLTFDHAYAIQREAEALLSGREYEMDSYDVLALVRKSECSAYDCEFVALAVRLGIRLVAMDKKVLGFPGEAVALKWGLCFSRPLLSWGEWLPELREMVFGIQTQILTYDGSPHRRLECPRCGARWCSQGNVTSRCLPVASLQ